MNKRILIISQHFYPEIGSGGNRIKNIYHLLVNKGYDVSIITTEPSYPNKKIYEDEAFWDDPFMTNDSPKISRIQVANRKYSRSLINRLFFFLEVAFKLLIKVLQEKQKYDIVFVTSPPIFIGMVGLVARLKFKSKFILDIRDLWPESLRGVGVFNNSFILKTFSLVEKILYKKADRIIVNSIGFINYISEKASVPMENIQYIPNSAREYEIDMDDKPESDFKVIYTGNIGLAQDIEFLKKIAKKLNENKIKLTIIGYGIKSRELKDYIQTEKMKNVSLQSPLTRKKCLEEIRGHHIGIVSLNSKKVFDTVLPGKVVDYMTCKIPIVASVSGYSKKVIEENNVGLVSGKRDVNEIYNYIKYLYDHPLERTTMSRNSERCIRENFLWEKNIKLLESTIHEL
ncbi:glycosyltransferase family 4 protein [Lederbergia citrea]|uniref:Glycosyltransferase family 4 protein n=1 Tax=Lederbergia citrea TaxID=2833581 RepID=A0A942URB7_9BACI|nr:glycosyltransferase family 4 protein [Lederbergia citrea]